MAARKTGKKPAYTEKGPPAAMQTTKTQGDWRDPDFKPADDDEGLEARMWRIAQGQQGKR